MRKLSPWIFVLFALALAALPADAQRRLTGQVTDDRTNEPLVGATVTVANTTIGTITGEDGRYSLQVPAGPVVLRVRRLGYQRRDLAVGPDQTTADVALERDVLQLETQVVTGQATSVARQNAANDIAVVEGEALTRTPTPTIENALQGKIAGATIQANSGAPGGGMQVQLRGVTTINAAVDPLYVIDGVIVSNATISPNTNAVTNAAGGGNASPQDNAVNRIADINPADIERIEVLKGASASAIYGSKAANGVIIITTKQGQQGRPQFNVTQRVGTYALARKFGSRNWTLDDALATFAKSAADTADLTANFAGGQDFEEQLFGETDLSWETDLSVRGGNENTRYYLSGLVKRDAGIMAGTGYDKQSFRGNITQQFGSRVTANIGTNFVHSVASRGLTNNDNAGVSYYMVLPFTPNFVNLQPRNGIYPDNPYERSNPFQTRDLARNREEVYRFIGSGNISVNLLQNERQTLVATLNGGVDRFTQANGVYSPPELFYEPLDGFAGTSVNGESGSVNSNISLNLTHTFLPAGGWLTATTSAGVQRERTKTDVSSMVTENLFAGQSNPDQGGKLSVFPFRSDVRALAFYAQEELLALDERLLLTVGARAERNSNNGDADKFFIFPKASASYRFLDVAPFMRELKVRAAYGQSGNQPLYGMKHTLFQTGNIDGFLGQFIGPATVKGNPDIRPERQTEIELGMDAELFDSRASLSATVYQKSIDDLILQRTVAPSTGYFTELFNGAELRNRGIELALAVTPVQRERLLWLSRLTFARNESEVTDLPVPAFEVGGFGTVLGAFKIEQGRSATQIVGIDNGEVRAIGDAAPDFQIGFSNDVAFGDFRIFGLVDWKQGGDVINLTKLLYDFGANSPDYGDDSSPGAQRLNRFLTDPRTRDYVEDASYVKLREITLAYTVPQALSARLFRGAAREARVELSGRNLYTWTDYTGVDPEVSNFGNQAIARNIDVAPYPPSRSYFLSVSVDF